MVATTKTINDTCHQPHPPDPAVCGLGESPLRFLRVHLDARSPHQETMRVDAVGSAGDQCDVVFTDLWTQVLKFHGEARRWCDRLRISVSPPSH